MMGMIMFFMIRSTYSVKKVLNFVFVVMIFQGNEVLKFVGLLWCCPQHERCDYFLPAEALRRTPC
jgi:hypothetical protein